MALLNEKKSMFKNQFSLEKLGRLVHFKNSPPSMDLDGLFIYFLSYP